MPWQMCVDNYHFPKLTVPKFWGKIQNLMFLQFIKTWTWTFLPDSLAPLCCCLGENSQFFSKTILLFPSSLFLELSAKFQMEGLQQGLVGGSSVKERRKHFFKNCCTTSNFQIHCLHFDRRHQNLSNICLSAYLKEYDTGLKGPIGNSKQEKPFTGARPKGRNPLFVRSDGGKREAC